MLLAVHRRVASWNIEGRSPRAGALFTKLAANVYHAVLSMPLTVRRRLHARDIEFRCRRA